MTRAFAAFLCGLVALFACVISSSQAQDVPVGTACTAPRVRKSWDEYTPDERTLYLEAVSTAMTRGFHQKFVELHIEFFSEREAHGNCMFIYWHRMYLLGYENMLRSLDPKFQCVTLPFWDHLAASALYASNQCSNVENCARIVTDFGGSTQGRTMTLLVYNVSIVPRSPGRCISASVLGSFCGNNSGCARCVVRGAPYNYKYPAEAAFASIYQQIFSKDTWEGFASNVETGVHST
ncbi:hypothetical protein PINS_up007558 [Pythium insidiosum]|nr:hypothetical protein PINS_up007558 [Pythium insidiosum]